MTSSRSFAWSLGHANARKVGHTLLAGEVESQARCVPWPTWHVTGSRLRTCRWWKIAVGAPSREDSRINALWHCPRRQALVICGGGVHLPDSPPRLQGARSTKGGGGISPASPRGWPQQHPWPRRPPRRRLCGLPGGPMRPPPPPQRPQCRPPQWRPLRRRLPGRPRRRPRRRPS